MICGKPTTATISESTGVRSCPGQCTTTAKARTGQDFPDYVLDSAKGGIEFVFGCESREITVFSDQKIIVSI